MFTAIGVEKTGQQTIARSDAMAVQRQKIPNEADYNTDVATHKAQGICDAMQGASDRARRVDEAQVLVNEIEVTGIDGTPAIPDNLSTVPLSVSSI
jgi:hypothetical protein